MANSDSNLPRLMKLAVLTRGNSNYHAGGWRLPDSYADAGSNFERWVELARKIESAKFDMLFVADAIGPLEFDRHHVFARSPNADRLEPLTLLSALSAVTKRLGLAATVATSYKPPYDLARQVASLDLISHGRAGWNIVTGVIPADAAQYGDEGHAPPAERYVRGEEYVDVVTALWASVEPDAFPRNKESGIYADPDKVHFINHKGKYYSVKGPLSVGPSPQGRPILIQAGQSDDGRALSSRVADVIFTAHSSFERAREFYSDVKQRAAAFGRDPEAVKILPGVMIIVGRTAKEAEEKQAQLNSWIDIVAGLARMQVGLPGIDLAQYPLDEPFPELPPAAMASRGINYVDMARRENLTLRQVVLRGAASNAHWIIKGTAVQIVDQLEHWFTGRAADGFNLLCSSLPAAIDDIIELVLPELRCRNLFRTEYEGRTLRENLGIPVAPIPRQRQNSAESCG
jgi:FMN-dependent oxidoreductase (nitrilotriacetate monooxygenase family)